MDAYNMIMEFHKLYYAMEHQTWKKTDWLGVPVMKCPLDLWVYQEIIFETKPDIIIETGTFTGGGALFMAAICDMLDHGQVISIDIWDCLPADTIRPAHPRIQYLVGSSTSEQMVDKVKAQIGADSRVLVVLDSDHSRDHVLKELTIYSQFVTNGSYVIVEDSNLNGNPVTPGFGPGPIEAIEVFLMTNKDFFSDRTREKFLLTFNPKGYLKRKTPGYLEDQVLAERDALLAERDALLAERDALLAERDALLAERDAFLRSQFQSLGGILRRGMSRVRSIARR